MTRIENEKAKSLRINAFGARFFETVIFGFMNSVHSQAGIAQQRNIVRFQ